MKPVRFVKTSTARGPFSFRVRPVYSNGERSPLNLTNHRTYLTRTGALRAAILFAADLEKSADDTVALRLQMLRISIRDAGGFEVMSVAA